jgi:hypothetical protein
VHRVDFRGPEGAGNPKMWMAWWVGVKWTKILRGAEGVKSMFLFGSERGTPHPGPLPPMHMYVYLARRGFEWWGWVALMYKDHRS